MKKYLRFINNTVGLISIGLSILLVGAIHFCVTNGYAYFENEDTAFLISIGLIFSMLSGIKAILETGWKYVNSEEEKEDEVLSIIQKLDPYNNKIELKLESDKWKLYQFTGRSSEIIVEAFYGHREIIQLCNKGTGDGRFIDGDSYSHAEAQFDASGLRKFLEEDYGLEILYLVKYEIFGEKGRHEWVDTEMKETLEIHQVFRDTDISELKIKNFPQYNIKYTGVIKDHNLYLRNQDKGIVKVWLTRYNKEYEIAQTQFEKILEKLGRNPWLVKQYLEELDIKVADYLMGEYSKGAPYIPED